MNSLIKDLITFKKILDGYKIVHSSGCGTGNGKGYGAGKQINRISIDSMLGHNRLSYSIYNNIKFDTPAEYPTDILELQIKKAHE